jgi:flagellar biosynthesis protein FliQ
MIPVLPTALTVLALVAAAWSVLLAILDRPIALDTRATLGLGLVVVVLEVGLLVQMVVGIVQAATTSRELETATFVGYLVGTAVLLPLGGFWAMAERSRWGAGVLAVACLAVPVMVLRMGQLWTAHV